MSRDRELLVEDELDTGMAGIPGSSQDMLLEVGRACSRPGSQLLSAAVFRCFEVLLRLGGARYSTYPNMHGWSSPARPVRKRMIKNVSCCDAAAPLST